MTVVDVPRRFSGLKDFVRLPWCDVKDRLASMRSTVSTSHFVVLPHPQSRS